MHDPLNRTNAVIQSIAVVYIQRCDTHKIKLRNTTKSWWSAVYLDKYEFNNICMEIEMILTLPLSFHFYFLPLSTFFFAEQRSAHD
jgi:hypothetical protein